MLQAESYVIKMANLLKRDLQIMLTSIVLIHASSLPNNKIKSKINCTI